MFWIPLTISIFVLPLIYFAYLNPRISRNTPSFILFDLISGEKLSL